MRKVGGGGLRGVEGGCGGFEGLWVVEGGGLRGCGGFEGLRGVVGG